MPAEAPTYDLMVLLSMTAEEERRAKILSDIESAINGAGTIVHNADWGTRPLAYQIDHQADAEYHLIQFTGPTSLLESLGHNLEITDGVLRHRIIKVLPGTPPPPAPERVAVAARAPTPGAESAPAGVGAEDAETPPAEVPGETEAPVETGVSEAPAEDIVPLDDEIVEADVESVE